MTIVLVAVGAVLSALGTRLAAVAFIAAGVSAVSDDTLITVALPGADPTLAAIVTWVAATGAGWLLLSRDTPRRLAVPALGLAAVLTAGAAPNGAVLLGCWVLGTAAAVVSRSDAPHSRRWALSLCALDLLVVAAVASAIGEGWPATLHAPGAIMLLVSAVLRAPLAAGPDDGTPMPGLLVVRAQCVVLAAFAIGPGSEHLAQAAVVVGIAAFAAAAWVASRPRVTDVVQELGLVIVVLGTARLGFGPHGWVWGALAGGTLIHYLRLTVGRATLTPLASALAVSAGIGLPFLPVVLAQLEGATTGPRWLAALLLIGALAGLAGRPGSVQPAPRRRAAPGVVDEVRVAVVVSLAAVASVAAAAFTLPSPPAAPAAPGPPLLAGAAVLVAGIAGSRMQRVVGRDSVLPARRVSWPPSLAERVGVIERVASDRVLWAALGALLAAAAATWAIGFARGFL